MREIDVQRESIMGKCGQRKGQRSSATYELFSFVICASWLCEIPTLAVKAVHKLNQLIANFIIFASRDANWETSPQPHHCRLDTVIDALVTIHRTGNASNESA